MKEIKLQSLEMKNFKGIKSLTIEPKGKNLRIFGKNETGKTTIADAWYWLLFHKDSKDQSTQKFDIKPLKENNEPIHQIETSVKGTLDINGSQLTLEKIYREVWQKKRGSNNEKFQGHTTDYFLSGAKVKKSEYEARINEIIDEEIFRLITDPLYFNEQLHWKERRRVLEQIESVDDEEVFEQNKELKQLAAALSENDIEANKKSLKRKMNDLNDEIEKIPIRIDEVNNNLPDVSGLNEGNIKEDIETLKEAKKESERKLNRLENGGETAELQKKLTMLDTELQKIKNSHREKYDEKIEKKKDKLDNAKDKAEKLEREIRNTKVNYEDRIERAKELDREIKELRQEFKRIQKERFDKSQFQTVTCPDCGNEFALQDVEEKEKKFNRKKAKKLEEINRKGSQKKQKYEQLSKKADELNTKKKQLENEYNQKVEKTDKIWEELSELREKAKKYKESDEYQKKLQEKKEVQQEIEQLREQKQGKVNEVKQKIKDYENDIAKIKDKLQDIKQHKKGQNRIEELIAKEKELAKKYEEMEREYYLCEQFEKEKAELLEEKINDRFELANFKLFEEQINGGIKETCRTLYKGVPFNTALNGGNRIKVGLDIIEILSDYYEVRAPIFVDNAEAVTGELETESQLIELIVSEDDEELRIK